MWVPWVKKFSTRNHTRSPYFNTFSFDNHLPSSNIRKHHSPSFKDIDALLHQPPLSPLHKHSLSVPFSLARSPPKFSNPASLKDIQSLLSDPTQTQAQAQPHTTNSATKPSIFHRIRIWANCQTHQDQPPPEAHNRVVVYYTSLRIVIRTCEDCKAVRSILKGYRVKMDERDLAMDANYIDELQRMISSSKKEMSLPCVYIDGKYVGGIEEIRQLHDSGELKKMIQGLPLAEGGICESCGGFRYVVCDRCNGSHKVCGDDKNGFKSCDKCNINGLIQCGHCTSVFY